VYLRSVLCYPLRFPHKNDVRFVFTQVVCRRAHVLFMLFVFDCHNGVQHLLTIGET
jgi:hypothetical protein